jgi:two-component system response regulator ArlR
MIKILFVEDDLPLALGMEYTLKQEGFDVIHAKNLSEARAQYKNNEFNIILLDVMLPDGTGYEFCKIIRESSEIPIIFMTACDEEGNVVMGLDMGGDDYITKPFAIEELLARIRTALKKRIVTEKKNEDVISCGSLSLDKMKHKVMYDNTEIELTNREFNLLQILMENKNIVLTRDVLIEKVCGYDYIGETNVIDVYVRFLRTKIDDAFKTKIITTVRGVGYVIKDE